MPWYVLSPDEIFPSANFNYRHRVDETIQTLTNRNHNLRKASLSELIEHVQKTKTFLEDGCNSRPVLARSQLGKATSTNVDFKLRMVDTCEPSLRCANLLDIPMLHSVDIL